MRAIGAHNSCPISPRNRFGFFTKLCSRRANLAGAAELKRAAGIRGRFNTSGNDGTITRFGWKAQNKSLLLFSGEAYNVEMGISNQLFPQEREEDPACGALPAPNDVTP